MFSLMPYRLLTFLKGVQTQYVSEICFLKNQYITEMYNSHSYLIIF